LEVLGRGTAVEVAREILMMKKKLLANLAPPLSAPKRREGLSP